MVFVNQTRSHCVIQMGKTQSKSVETRHGVCELASKCVTSFRNQWARDQYCSVLWSYLLNRSAITRPVGSVGPSDYFSDPVTSTYVTSDLQKAPS